jgi:hypothetical protein
MKTRSDRFWLILLGTILVLSAALCAYLYTRTDPGTTAVITLDGAEVERIDLSAVKETYTLTYTGKSGVTDVVEVSPGQIRVLEADCPDQICVKQGWIKNSVAPIVCLPNALVIQITDAPDAGVDAVVG